MIHNYYKKLINTPIFICIGFLFFTNVNAQTPIGASPYIVPSSGNYTIPAGITQITVECIGGGGAGGGSGNANAYRGGGGGGAYVQVANYTVSPGGILTIQVGAGGAGVNTTAVVNGQPSFVSYNSTTFISAAGGSGTGSNTGGAGGQIASNIPASSGFAGGNGGNGASCCTFNKAAGGGGGGAGTTGAGNNGGNGTATSTAWTGGAGGSLKANFGGAGGAGISSDANCPANTGGAAPANATNYGGGGGGCTQYAGACGTASIGGNGARGLVRITYNSCATPGQPAAITPTSVCQGVPTTLTTSATGSPTSYTWSLPNGWTGTSTAATISVTSNATSGNVTVTANNTCGASTPTSTNITVTPVAVAPTAITGTTTICSGNTTTLTATGGDANTEWYTGSCGGSKVGTGASYTTGQLTGNTSYYAANVACGTTTSCASATVTVNAKPNQPAAITPTSVCQGVATTLTTSATGSPTSYTWSLPNGWTGTSTAATISVTSNATSGNVTVTANNTCGASTPTPTNITVTPAALAPTAITGTTTICSGTSTTLSATGGDTATRWYTGSCGGTQVGTGVSFTTPNLSTATTYYAANKACGGITSCVSVTVNITSPAVAPTAITGTTAICTGTSTTLTATGGNATTKWFTGSCGGTQVGTGASLNTPNLSTATTYYAANEVCSTFSSCASTTVNITAAAVAPTAITGTTAICTGTSTTLTATGGNATTKWFTGSCGGTQVGTGASLNTPNLSTATTYYAANEVCSTLSSCANTSVTINNVPAQPDSIKGPSVLCANSAANYTTVNVNGLNYTWSLPAGWNGNSTTNQISITAGGNNGTISVTASNNCGPSTARTLVVTVNPLPTVTLDTFKTVCSTDAPFTLTGGKPAGGTYTINGTVATTFNPSGSVRSDTVTYRYIDGNTCSASATQIQKVKICSGIEDATLNAIKIFPNPVKEEMTVSIDKGIYDIVVIDAVGRTIENYKWTVLQAEEKKINMTAWSSGVYFMYLHEKSRSVQFLKFIKE